MKKNRHNIVGIIAILIVVAAGIYSFSPRRDMQKGSPADEQTVVRDVVTIFGKQLPHTRLRFR
jgi:hypothetical protein